ncbi:4-cresol dehydrogenase (hydroxylating) flavoprotein subunit [Lasiodiplodia theobromae]|uniref:4-cresol dehydrogenase (Hydroxylating) flavoprotein subunit n=1 Tax=Lasiodiplodia theobromae TaxID=45133 RepID=A0A5N5DNG2_9PEZI|nr:4-cresol dehydrogenase (hydroxylating) flavoprotein subunit [Lasiodiplodia theobromae]
MAPTRFPERYHDPEYQSTHRALHSESLTRPLEAVLPPGVSQADFDSAIKEYAAIVGHDGVFTGQALEDYIDPYELWEADGKRRMPSGAVCPRSIEELRGVLRISNKYGIPVWTFSRGKNLGYGGPAPRLNGSLSLDLHRMNKIIEVNEKFAYAVVEPGVTFTDLYEHCAKHKLKVWPSVPSLGWGSVIGNTLDRGTGFTPTATHHQHICGLEAMLADGTLVRSGQYGVTHSPSAHLSKFSFGPSVEGLFLQSNLGVVTKMGIWLTPAPAAYMACAFDAPDSADIEAIVEVFGALRRDGLLPSTVYVSGLVEWAAMMGKRTDVWKGAGPIPEARLKELQEQLGVGAWNARFGLYGRAAVVRAQFDELKAIVEAKIPRGRLQGTLFAADQRKGETTLDPTSVPEPHGGFWVGVPSLWSLPMVKFRLPEDGRGVAAHIDYSPIIPSDGKVVLDWVKTAKGICEAEGFDLMCDFFMHERHVIFVNMMTFDKTDAEQRRAVEAIFQRLFQEGKKRGFSKYRSHVNYMDQVADLYDFNNHAYRLFVEKLKDTLDPNGILSPGKQGIWPRKYRDKAALKSHL